MKKRKLLGKKFGRLTVLRDSGKRYNNSIIYECLCDCGNICYVISSNIGRSTNSCGCLETENRIIHNQSRTRLYNIWTNMKQRCLNVNNPRYKNYGGRGIKICQEWLSFDKFYEWAMASGYKEDDTKRTCTLDRENVNLNYTPDNCRWITNKQQQNNKTNTVYYEYNNEKHTISEWAEILSLPLNNLKSRISKGWDIKRVLEQPIKYKKRK